MEVTFLSSTGSFAGVAYNLSKVYKNAAEVMEASHFDGLRHVSNPTIKDYTDYLKLWTDKNTRIKHSQLHVAISCKGKERSKEELLAVAKEWMKEMGYEDNPTLYIFHHDTNNNHIHIITSRVDKYGKKVNDSNERWRGRDTLKRIEGISESIDKLIAPVREALGYIYTTKHQFTLILERQNYKVEEKENGDLEVKKYGKPITTISASEIETALKNNREKGYDSSRQKQIKALLYKYKDRMNLDELQDMMKRTFGLEMVFFGQKDKPYGYAIIDHKEKAVYKGGVIMSIKELMSKGAEQEKADKYTRGCSILELLLEKYTISQPIYAELKRYGYAIKDGQLSHYGKDVGRLPESIIGTLKQLYNVERAKQIHTNDPKIIEAIARHYNISPEEFSPSEGVAYHSNKGYRSLQELYDRGRQQGELYAFLKLNNAYLFYDSGRAYVIDNDSGCISQVNDTHPEREMIIDTERKEYIDEVEVTAEEVIDIFSASEGQSGGVDNTPKKRRR